MADTPLPQEKPNKSTVRVEPITKAEDLAAFFDITAATFGRQTNDGIWLASNPGWDTSAGRERAVARLVRQWSSSASSTDRNGELNKIYLKATVPRGGGGGGGEDIAGVAIWIQASMVEGYGERPSSTGHDDADDADDVLYPGNPAEERYVRQLEASLHRRRLEVLREIASTSSPSPAVMVLGLCVVHPAFQGQGIATRLVEWGLGEARRRGGLEAVTEASSMGRHVYAKLGFWQEGGEIEYLVDEEFRGRDLPSNVFMRTGRPG
ncbi:GNAT family N-acetyltransferase [Aspergillus lucknowensis]|uniref:N-acetyltransferase domain-containing protein n=1 Tax=Aspergillus lucknowensis TaxID=176173 RepID=A0ABR4M035_9EURO